MASTSSNWSGYVAGPGPFTSASGTFNVPGLVATPTTTVTSIWVGIDGVGPSTSLIQAGVQESYDPATGLVTTQAWWEILPAPETPIPWSQLSVMPGHSVSVRVAQVGGTTWALTVADNTTGQSYTTDQYYPGGQATAEWIVEAPTDATTGAVDTLGYFSPPVAFTNAGIAGTQSTLDALTMVQGGLTVAVPSAYSSGAFSVAYTGQAPAPPPTPTPTPAATPAPAPTVYTVAAGQPFTLTLTGGSPGLAAQWQVSSNELSWAPLVNVTFDGSGSSAYAFTPTQTAFYQTWYPTLGRYGSWIIEVVVQAAASPTPSPAPTGTVPPTIFTVTAGSSVTISQSGPPSTAFTLQTSTDGVTWTALAQLATDASGNASCTFVPSATAYYRALFPAGPTATAVGVVLPTVSSALTITGPRVITWGSGATLTVTMANEAGRQVQVLATRDSATWAPVATLAADASGTAAFAYRPATNLYYRAVFSGAPGLPGESSDLTRTVVRQIALPRYATGGVRGIARGTTLSFPVVIRPDRPELPAPVATFRLYGWTGSAWAPSLNVKVTADASGVATFRVNFRYRGLWYVTAMADPTPYNANSVWTRREEVRVY